MKSNSTAVHSAVYHTLKSDSSLGNRVYPIVASEGTSYPFCVYTQTGMTAERCKDGIYGMTYTYSVDIVASTCYQATELSDKAVNNLIDMKSSVMHINNIDINSVSEQYAEDGYINTIMLTINVDN